MAAAQNRLAQAWASLWVLRRHHAAPAWARLLVAAMAAVGLALSLMAMVAVFATNLRVPNWWLVSLLPNVVICMCIVYAVLGVLRLCEVLLPPARLAWLARGGEDWRAGLALSVVVIVGIMIGMTIGFTIGPQLVGSSAGALFISLPAALFKFVLFLFVMGALNWIWWNARVRHQHLRQEALEAQLRLLQAQIEPHFLFNTLVGSPGTELEFAL